MWINACDRNEWDVPSKICPTDGAENDRYNALTDRTDAAGQRLRTLSSSSNAGRKPNLSQDLQQSTGRGVFGEILISSGCLAVRQQVVALLVLGRNLGHVVVLNVPDHRGHGARHKSGDRVLNFALGLRRRLPKLQVGVEHIF